MIVPLRYLKILPRDVLFVVRGEAMNGKTWLMLNVMSCLIRVTYCKSLKINLYQCGSKNVLEPCLLSLTLLSIGVGAMFTKFENVLGLK